MDSHYIKLQGKAELPEPLKLGENYTVAMSGAIIGITTSDNEDGTVSYGYKFRPIMVELATSQGQRIRAKDTRSRSQQLRALLWKKWREQNVPVDFDNYYDQEMLKIMEDINKEL